MRIVFADDHNLIRESVSTLLKKISGDVEVLEASNFDEAFDQACRGPLPDLIILDLFMPGMNHLNGLDAMGRRFPGIPIVILTGAVDLNDAYTALERGAAGYIPKTIGCRAMLNALRLVLSGEKFLPSMLVAEAERVEAAGAELPEGSVHNPTPLDKLTRREREVLSLLTGGHPNKEIARRLGLREITVKVHLKGVYRKLGVANRTQAVRTVFELGLSSAARRHLSASGMVSGLGKERPAFSLPPVR